MNEVLHRAMAEVKARPAPQPWVRKSQAPPRPKNHASPRAIVKRSDIQIPIEASVYLIQGERSGLVKIGYASDPRQRLYCLQSGSGEIQVVLGFISTTKKTEESRLHRKFAQYCAHGEWFHPAPEILAEFGVG